MAAQLLSKLVTRVITALDVGLEGVFLWSDSTIVLNWIKLPPYRLTTFVANRTTEIQEATSNMQWRHISGKQNPADVLSRGSNPVDLITNELWWHGPQFLIQSEDQWPTHTFHPIPGNLPELQKSFISTSSKPEDIININKYSSFSKLQRVMGYCLRFIKNTSTKKREDRLAGRVLSAAEMNDAVSALVKMVQHQEFHDEIQKFINHKSQSLSINVNLSPFLDPNGLVRVGGRLDKSALSYDARHPYLLPKHHLTELIISHVHKQNLHGGIQSTLAAVRQNFWPTNGVNVVKRVIHRCIQCYKVNPRLLQQIMGDIPPQRMETFRPFNITGVDYCGPFHIRYKHQRKETSQKMYVCVFVCYSTKAVHLDIAEDASSQAFIDVLKRFTSRRGKPSTIWSDNGTNFVGGANQLEQFEQLFKTENNSEILQHCSTEGIQFKFIPPRSPHFGGLWESTVKIFKLHLKKVMHGRELIYQQFLTLITQIEGIMNSRPLTPISSDARDFLPLTPGHFLTGGPINALTQPNITLPDNRLKAWQLVTKMQQHFWQRFSSDYLQSIQTKSKWLKEHPNLEINDMVLIHQDGIPPTIWPLGRVVDTIKGKDQKVRVVMVRTKSGIIKRVIAKLSKLPIEGWSRA